MLWYGSRMFTLPPIITYGVSSIPVQSDVGSMFNFMWNTFQMLSDLWFFEGLKGNDIFFIKAVLLYAQMYMYACKTPFASDWSYYQIQLPVS